MTKKKPKSQHKEAGRPSIMTKEVIEKLENAFRVGLTDEEACFSIPIDKGTLYNYCKSNPDFSTRKETLKRSLIVRSKYNLATSINEGNVLNSKWLLERKAKDEYSVRNETTGKDGGAIETKTVYIEKEEKAEMHNHINETIGND